jgi:hypothetical protein
MSINIVFIGMLALEVAHTSCRYLSMALIIISNTGFFYDHFSLQTCVHYAYVTPAFKGTVPLP